MVADGGGHDCVRIRGRPVSIALQEILQFEGTAAAPAPGLTAWLGMIEIVAGVLAILAGHMRYHQTLAQIERGTFEPPRLTIDVSALLLAAFGLVLADHAGEEIRG